jgi:periplasmic protein TonB
MFEDSTFESVGAIHTRTGGWMMATFALNGTILLALVLIPLLYPQMLPSMVRSMSMETPPPPLEPVRLQPAPWRTLPSASQGSAPALQPPTVIPKSNPYADTPQVSNSIDWTGLAQNGYPIGARNDPFGPGSDIRVIEQKPHAPAPVSQGVMTGLLLFKPVPVYPRIAIASRTEGIVVLEAIISKTGFIENLRVVSGPAMLRQAALDAVRQWRYRPYTLDGQVVEVETEINVVFKLN